MPRLGGFGWTLVGLAAAGVITGWLMHAFRFHEPAPGALTGRLENAFPKLRRFDYPVWFGHAGDGSGRVFVVEKKGIIHVFTPDAAVSATETFLDLSDIVYQGHQEEGMLGLAFDPAFAANGHLYIHYSRRNGRREPRFGRIARFTVDPERPNRVQRDSELVILEQKQPWGNHNGGCLVFGPDGYLYFSLGDGGAAADPLDSGQDLKTLLGTICRIDVRKASRRQPYAIPRGNPFKGRRDARPEIWAWGLRNAWRFSFDRVTKDCWAGDVGQNKREEVDLIVRGGNYGWRAYEAELDFDSRQASPAARRRMIFPVVSYPRDKGQSVTGGYVYRGTQQPSLAGRYIYADYGSTFLWALDYDRTAKRVRANDFLGRTGVMISSFGEDAAGEVYAVAFDGRIYRVVAESK